MKIPIDECPAGPAMDAAVARILDGHLFDGTGVIENRDGTVSEFCKRCGKPKGYHSHARYSVDIAEAWKLNRYAWAWACQDIFLPGIGLAVEVVVQVQGDKIFKGVATIDECGMKMITETGKAYALARCRAFLKANGVESVETESNG